MYPLVRGLTGKTVQNAVKTVLDAGIEIGESLSEKLLKDYSLISLREAIKEIHFPTDKAAFQIARKRLVFEEFYRFTVNVRRMKENARKESNSFEISPSEQVERFVSSLPYELTGAQKSVYA